MIKYTTDINNNITFNKETYNTLIKDDNSNKVITIFKGMGGALTQATNYNYMLLNDDAKKELINLYFKDLKYKYIRMPIGSCDFSPYPYEVHKWGKINLDEDKLNIWPMLKDIRKYKLIYMLSPWSPPKKWKNPLTNKLLKINYNKYANYLIDYINK